MDDAARAEALDQALVSDLGPATQEWHVVADGAKFDDLAALLAAAGIMARSLFLGAGAAQTAAGPFLARLDEPALRRLLRIPAIAAASVFWLGPVEEAALYHHLRGLNLIDIPRVPASGALPGPALETVLFRHWDPSVMAMTFPVLDPAQRSRLFGPMQGLALSDDAGVVRLGQRKPDAPAAPRGRLRLSRQQLDMMDNAVAARSRRAIGAYLRQSAPHETESMDEPTLLAFVARAEADGRDLGLTRERALGQFCYLSLVGQGRIEATPEARRFLLHGPGRADDRVGQLMLAMAAEIDRRGGRPP